MANPLVAIIIWAAAADYPTGAGYDWDGQPTKASPGVTFWTPSEAFAPTAPGFNWKLNLIDQGLANLTAWTQCADGGNWGALASYPTGGGAASGFPYWSNAFGCWLVAVNPGSGWQTLQSSDGSNWTDFGNNPGTTRQYILYVDIPTTVTNGKPYVAAIVGDSTSGHAAKLTLYAAGANGAAGTWGAEHAVATGANTTSVGAVGCFWFAAGAPTTSQVLVYHQTNSGSGALIAGSSTLGLTGFAITGSSLPVGFGENSSGLPLLSAANTTVACLFSPVFGQSGYVYSTDGFNWTQNTTLGTSALTIVGAGYDATNAVFYVMATSATTGALYSTTDPTSATAWTLVRSFNFPVQSFACNGGELATLLKIEGNWRIVLSTDGGVTWGYAKANAVSSAGKLSASGNGFLYTDASDYAVSHAAGTPAPMLY